LLEDEIYPRFSGTNLEFKFPDKRNPKTILKKITKITIKSLTIFILILIFLTCSKILADTHYVSPAGGNTPPYTNWSTAAHNIQEAVDAASGDDTVLVTNGVYASGGGTMYDMSNRVLLVKAVSLQSVNGPGSTVILGAPDPETGNVGDYAVRCAYLTNGAELAGFTLSNGFTKRFGQNNVDCGGGSYLDNGGFISNCVIAGNMAGDDGGGIYILEDGMVINCRILGNIADDGGGVYCDSGGTIRSCVIVGNKARRGGGTIYGNIENCAIIGNFAGSYGGGGTYYGNVRNCTVMENTAWKYGGGVYRSTVRNSIVYFNKSYDGMDNFNPSGGSLRYSCTMPLPSGSGNFTNDPQVLSFTNPHIVSNSPCKDSGYNSYVYGTTDIDGEPRITDTTVDVGCDEFLASGITGVLSVAILADVNGALINTPVTFHADIQGKANWFLWDLGDGQKVTNSPLVSYSYAVAGTYQVVLAAWNNDTFAAATSTFYVAENFTNYVSLTGGHVAPFTNWASAANTIQDAINSAYAGGVVLIADGEYTQNAFVKYGASNRIGIYKQLTVSATNDNPEATIIVGDGALGDTAERCAYIGDKGTLIGVTLSNGYTKSSSWSGGGYFEQSGGGAWCELGASISNCLIRGNRAWDYGGGTFGGTLVKCGISGNSATYGGGGAAYGYLLECTISSNTANQSGGGTYYGTMQRCVITHNFSFNGGGSQRGLLQNCLIFQNTAKNNGGATDWSTVENCTVVGNTARLSGGLYCGYAANSIVYYNEADSNPLYDNFNQGNKLTNCCTFPEPAGPGNITNSPGIIAFSNPHILSNSPCINAGTNAYAAGVVDIDLEPRISGGIVDIGCDEFIQAGITGELSAVIIANYTNILVGETVLMESAIRGKANLTEWTLWNGEHLTNTYHFEHKFTSPGLFPVILTAWNNEGASAATVTVHVVEGFTNYVSLAGGNVPPYSSWATAANTLQDAVDACYAGGIVLVAPGNYDQNVFVKYGAKSRVGIDKPLTLQADDPSPESTVIVGQGPLGDNAVRCAYLGFGAKLIGLTLSNGFTKTEGDWMLIRAGGGAWCEGANLISNCLVVANSAIGRAGGLFCESGMVYNCTIQGNSSDEHGGLSCQDGSLINRCVISNNLASYAAGIGCWDDCYVLNSLIVGNRAIEGGESYGEIGGVSGGTVQNCTIAGNSANVKVGGARNCTLWNSIVYNNTAPEYPNSTNCTFNYSCTTPLPAGEGNIMNDPEFVSSIDNNWRLQPTSFCIDAGTNAYAWGNFDLDGNPRIYDDTVDMGCYEFIPEPGTLWIMTVLCALFRKRNTLLC